MSSQSLQLSTSRAIIANSLALMTTGLLFGTQIAALPYYKLGVIAHTQFLNQAIVWLLLSILLHQQIVTVTNAFVLRLAHLGNYSAWIICLSEVYSSFTGAYGLLKLGASGSGLVGKAPPGGSKLEDQVIDICHIIPSSFLLLSYAAVLYYAVTAGQAKREAAVAPGSKTL